MYDGRVTRSEGGDVSQRIIVDDGLEVVTGGCGGDFLMRNGKIVALEVAASGLPKVRYYRGDPVVATDLAIARAPCPLEISSTGYIYDFVGPERPGSEFVLVAFWGHEIPYHMRLGEFKPRRERVAEAA
jgi:hypothetical protein